MRRSAVNTQPGPQDGIKKSRADLADTAARIHSQFIIKIHGRIFIPLVTRTRADSIIKRAGSAGFHQRMVQETRGNAYVFAPVGIAAVKMSRIT